MNIVTLRAAVVLVVFYQKSYHSSRMESALYRWVVDGIGTIIAIQSWRTPLLDGVFRSITVLGNTEFYLLAIPLIYWNVNKDLGKRIAYLVVASGLINEFTKNLFAMPRPFTVNTRVTPLMIPGSYGLPSGHTMIPTIFWGYLAWGSGRLRRIAFPAVGLFVAVIAFSRMYLGVHFPADIVTGFLLGCVVLLLWVGLESAGEKSIPSLPDWLRIVLLSIVAVLFAVLTPADPHGYPAEGAVTAAGVLFGMTIGFPAEAKWVRFTPAGSLLQKTARYLVGFIVIAAAWFGLRQLFGLIPAVGVVDAALRFVRYAITGVALTWWAPALFVRLRLVDSEFLSILPETPSSPRRRGD